MQTTYFPPPDHQASLLDADGLTKKLKLLDARKCTLNMHEPKIRKEPIRLHISVCPDHWFAL